MIGIGKKLLASAGLMAAATLAYLPGTAAAACSCMCVDGSPDWVCTTGGFGSTAEPAPDSCAVMECPVTTPPADTTDPGTGGDTPPVADGGTVEPPEPGLVCKRRSVYRPDLGKYKTYKVCHPRLTEEQIARLEAFKQKIKERIAKRKARYAKYARHGKRNWRWRS